jgi:hypothetical protein
MLLVIGGHSRNIGKTSVMAGIIAALPEARWQAIKITQHGHTLCEHEGKTCHCKPADPRHPYALDPQRTPDSTDSGRYLAAGAARSWWLRTARGRLGEAAGIVKNLVAAWPHTIVESNSILHFVRPDLYVPVLDFTIADMKDSARLFLNRADALVVVGEKAEPPWQGIPGRWLHKPAFAAVPPCWAGADLVNFIRSALPEDANAPR